MPLTEFNPQPPRLVCVVDDDDSVRRGLSNLLRSLGYQAQAFATGDAFLQSPLMRRCSCLLLDVVMAGMGGPELQRRLLALGRPCPIIFITAYVDAAVEDSVRRAGAIGLLCKPFSEEALTTLMAAAFEGHDPDC